MATLTDYKGLDVVEGATGDGGIALTENFKELADRAPYQAAGNPGVNNDSTQGFSPGDNWLNTSSQVLWACVSNSTGAAAWKSVLKRTSTALELTPQESSERVQTANLSSAGYARIGSHTVPVNTTAGDLTAQRLSIGNGSLGGVIARIDGQISGTAAGPLIGIRNRMVMSPPADSAADLRVFNLSLELDTTNNLSSPQCSSEYVEVRVINSGNINSISGSRISGLFLGSTANSLGTVGTVHGVTVLPVVSFSNPVTATIGAVHGVQVNNSTTGLGPLNITGQSGVTVSPLTAASNNTHLLLGQDAIPSGNYAIYSASTSPSYFAGPVDINNDKLRLRTAKTPASASATGNQGDVCWDDNYVYVCIATNTWKRSPLASW